MKQLLMATTLVLMSMGVNAQTSTLLCVYKGTNVPISINYTNSTATNIFNEVRPATINNSYIEFVDGKNTRVSINRFTGQMILNDHHDKPLQCTEIK